LESPPWTNRRAPHETDIPAARLDFSALALVDFVTKNGKVNRPAHR
jgi:hypothetical protein